MGYNLITSSEISAQKAAYCCLGVSLSESRNAEVFINTELPDKRVEILKS